MAQTIISESAVVLNADKPVDRNAPVGPVLKLVKGRPMVSSREIADHFGKRHADLIRSIAAIIRNAPESFNERNFALVEYTDPKGEKRPAYDLTRDGFVIVAMGFTGKKAIMWKIAYIQAFNAMEAELMGRGNPTGTLTTSQQQELKELVQAKASAYPDAVKPKVFSQIWTRLQRKFKVPRYSELPVSVFGEARDYVISMQMRSVDVPALPASDKLTTIRDYAWFYPALPTTSQVWRQLSFKAADAFERFGKEIDAIKDEAFRPFKENRRSGVATFLDDAMGPHYALFRIADEQMRTAYRCIYEAMDGLVATFSMLRKG